MDAKPAYGDDAPIAAFATPLAESALALIRLSGNSAIELLSTIFSRPKKLLGASGYSIVHGWIIDAVSDTIGNSNSTGIDSVNNSNTANRIDEVLVGVYRAPRSYSGEDGADISCHGGIAAAKAVMGALKAAGFRDALPGEFTFRAFMNGKLDLTRSESVMELVNAKTSRGLEHAVKRLSGVLEQEITGIKNLLVKVLAETEIYLDYSEDEFSGTVSGAKADDAVSGKAAEEASASAAAEAAGNFPGFAITEEVRSRLQILAASYRRERLYHEGALAVIAGRPNAGKSSLFNLLLKEDRSIVTEVPGTTRDWIEALISIEGIPVRLADTAGLRGLTDDTANSGPLDPVEKIGIERSRELLSGADLVLYVIDGSEGITGEDLAFLEDFRDAVKKNHAPSAQELFVPALILWNKADIAACPAALPPVLPIKKDFNGNLKQGETVLPVSAKTGAGIPELTAAMAEVLTLAAGNGRPCGSFTAGGEYSGNTPGIATTRQKELVDTALAAVEEVLGLAKKGEPLDLIAPLLREAVNSLGEITGEVSTADILETMFSRFCVGK
jgi:tRNA modification GTPase